MKTVLTASIILLAGGAAAPAIACERHDKQTQHAERSKEHSPKSISFQPNAPASPSDGHIWIDARDGRIYVFIEGAWIDRATKVARTAKSTAPQKEI